MRRSIVMVVDSLGISWQSAEFVRRPLRKFIEEQIQPGDLAAVIRTGASIGALQQFTSDKRLLLAAVERVRWNGFSRTEVDPTDQDDVLGQLMRKHLILASLDDLRYVVDALREMPGRKSLVLFTEDMRILDSQGQREELVTARLERIADVAHRAGVVIYSIDPRGLPTLTLQAKDAPPPLASMSGNLDLLSRRWSSGRTESASEKYVNSQEGMNFLAHETGGLFYRDDNDLVAGVKEVLDDQQGYYLIGYRPDASTFDAATGQRKFHTIKVRVKRSGLTVRSRNGFLGQTDQELRPAPAEAMASALMSPFHGDAIAMRMTPSFFNNSKEGSFLHLLLHIDPGGLTFTEEPDGARKIEVEVMAMTFGDNGKDADRIGGVFTTKMRGEAYTTALSSGFSQQVKMMVKKPGAYQLRAAVRDVASGRIGSAGHFVEVPDVSQGRLALSGILLKTASQQPSALRLFRPGDTLTYGYQVLNAQVDGKRLEKEVRLYRDGKVVLTDAPAPLTPTAADDPKRLLLDGTLRLDDKLATGDYILQLIVTDKLADNKSQTAAQWIDFEVAP